MRDIYIYATWNEVSGISAHSLKAFEAYSACLSQQLIDTTIKIFVWKYMLTQ